MMLRWSLFLYFKKRERRVDILWIGREVRLTFRENEDRNRWNEEENGGGNRRSVTTKVDGDEKTQHLCSTTKIKRITCEP